MFGEPFHEYTHAEEGEAVMGKEYEGELPVGNVSARFVPGFASHTLVWLLWCHQRQLD